MPRGQRFYPCPLLAARPLPTVLVLLLTADECLASLDLAIEGAVEGVHADGVPQAVGYKPCGFLRDAEVVGELRTGDAILVRRDKPDHQ